MEELETISPEFVADVKERYRSLFKIQDEKIYEVLKLIDYGRLLPEIWKGGQEPDYERKISKICKIDVQTAHSVMQVIVTVLRRMREKDFISRRVSDLTNLGFKRSEIRRFIKIAKLLKKNKAYDEITKVSQWEELSQEVLPSLTSIECAFDIRCKIERDRIETYVPIVLLKFEIETEEEGVPKDLVFQTNLGTFRHIVRSLTEIYRNSRVLSKYRLKA